MNPTSTSRDVLVIGDYYVDLVFAGLPRWPQPGEEVFCAHHLSVPGGAFTHHRALSRLGVPTRWAAELGNDPYSDLVLDAARAENLDTSAYLVHSHPVRNISVAVSHTGERGFISYKEPIAPRDGAAAILAHRPSCVLLTELRVGAGLDALVDAAREVGALIMLDCQHVEATLADPEIAGILRAIDVVLPNAAEAAHLTGSDDLHHAVDLLVALAPMVVVKNGPGRAVAATAQRRETASPPPVEVVDTIGAGDCFDAGFIAGHLAGLDLAECLRLATICGAIAVTGYGGAAAPTLDQIARHSPDLVPWAVRSP